MLAQARWGGLSEADGLAWAKSSSLSECTTSLCLWVMYGLFVCEFLKYRNYMPVFVVFWLDGLSPIGVWDVLDGWTHDGHGTV